MKKIFPLAALLALFCTRLEVPELLSPADGETLLTATPEFIWHPASNARSYSVEISAEESFAETIDSIVFEDTSFILADTLKLGQEYHWRVTARNLQGDESDPSQAWSFKVKEGVKLLTPEPFDSTAFPEFSWESYPGASSYNFVLSSYADFREPFFDTTTGSTSLQWPDSLAPATYFWRVQAFDADQPLSSWSVVRRLVSYRMADTYFPLYVGRSQTYNWFHGEGIFRIGDPVWDTTVWTIEQVTITVDDVTSEGTRFIWTLSDSLWDVGNIVAVEQDSLFGAHFFMSKLYPEDTIFRIWHDSIFDVSWNAETLIIHFHWGRRYEGSAVGAFDTIGIMRLPGQGVVRELFYRERIITASENENSWTIDSLELRP